MSGHKQALPTQLETTFGGYRVVLRHDGTALLPELNTLLVADLHLGKEHSFRAQQIPVPEGPSTATLEMLTESLLDVAPQRLVILGDLIHDENSMHLGLVKSVSCWRALHARIDLILIRGNHDRHVKKFPDSWDLRVVSSMSLKCIPGKSNSSATLVHQAPVHPDRRHFIEGHWHPVVRIGKGVDQLRVRCFAQRPNRLTLPAFGPFKGGSLVDKHSAKIFPLAEGHILSS